MNNYLVSIILWTSSGKEKEISYKSFYSGGRWSYMTYKISFWFNTYISSKPYMTTCTSISEENDGQK